jgi:hypothetical protein
MVFSLAGCATVEEQSPVEIREYQTRVYEGVDSLTVYKAVVNALQDDGFVLETSDAYSGIIVATMDSTIVSFGKVAQKAALTAITYGFYWLWADPNVKSTWSINVTANITETPDGIKTRLNFVGKKFDSKGHLVRAEQIQDKSYYHKFFTRIEKSIFLEENI